MIFTKKEENPYRNAREIIYIGFLVYLALLWFEVSMVESARAPWFIAIVYEYGGKWLVAGFLWLFGIIGVLKYKTGPIVALAALLGIAGLVFYDQDLGEFILSQQGKDGVPAVLEKMFEGDRIEYRTFTDTQGRTIQARVLDHDDHQVRIEREDGSIFTIEMSTLSEADQAYVKRIK